MAKKVPGRVRTLGGFLKWAEQFNDGQYLFRGVPDKTYKIEPSASRRLPNTGRNNPVRLLKINQELIEKARLLGHDQLSRERLSDLPLLSELQHFRAATCLIDFTSNALVALWFACEQTTTKEEDLNNENNLGVENTNDEKEEVDGKVYAVRVDDPSRYRTITSDLLEDKKIEHFFKVDNNNRYPLYQWQPKRQNNRIIAQQSVFIFGGAKIEPADECVIKKDGKEDLLRTLDKVVGLTDATIYPDADGFARLHVQSKQEFKPDAEGYLQQGIKAHQKGERLEAISCYTRVISPPPGEQDADIDILFWAHHHRGIAYLDEEDSSQNVVDLAIKDFNKAIDMKKEMIDTESENLPSKAKRLKQDLAKTYVHRGLIHYGKGDIDKAIEDYAHATELDPAYADAYNQLGNAYLNSGDLDLAIDKSTKATKLDPDLTEAYIDLGIASFGKGDFDGAIDNYTEALEKDPDDTSSYINRGLIHQKNDDSKEALEDLGRAIQLNPSDGNAYYYRGTVLLKSKRWKEAENNFKSAETNGIEVAKKFKDDFGSIEAFEQNTDITLQEDIKVILRQSENI